MGEMRVYLDNQATTRCDPAVLAVMLPLFADEYGNPHSADHAMGRQAAGIVDVARGHVASLLGAEPREIVFTSGATEANNLAIKGAARFAGAGERRRIVTLATEHKCVLESVRDLGREGFEPVILPVGQDGLPDLELLRATLEVPTLLVSVMAVNNETGIIQNIGAIARMAREAGALFHTDAAQAAGKIPLDLGALGVDLASVSAHKLYGPKGIGALYVRRRPRVRLEPLFSGGGQERGARSGTLPVPLVAGFGEACRLALQLMQPESLRIEALRSRFLSALADVAPAVRENAPAGARIPGCISLRFPQVNAQELLALVPELCLSTGSACTSADLAPSHVLTGMGLSPAEAASTLRVGLGRFTSAAEIDFAAAVLGRAYAQLSALKQPVPAEA